jgi:hypothetical protein
VALRTEELVSEGMSADLARAEALRRFGNLSEIHRTVTAIDRNRSAPCAESNGSIHYWVIFVRPSARCAGVPVSPLAPRSRWVWASVSTPPSSPYSKACCCARCPLPSP